jgi:exosortase/archaeosortase
MPRDRTDILRTLFSIRVLGAAAAVAVLIAGVGFGVDHLVHRTSRLYASDLYTLIVAFVLSYAVMMYEKRRRAMLLRRMMVAAEVNHHIRNALTAVVFKASVQNDPELQAVIEDAAARVDWVLRTVLPDGSKDLKWPIQAPDWHAANWRSETGEAER